MIHWWCTDDGLMMRWGGMHFVYGASPQHILLHFPIKLLHLPIKFASFPQQIASFPQQFASFPQQIASFPQHSFSLPQHILCHFAKHRIKVFFCDLFSFLPFLAVPRQLYWWSEWWRDLTWPKKAMTNIILHNTFSVDDFDTLSSSQEHMLVHSGEKLIRCTECKYACTRASNLK